VGAGEYTQSLSLVTDNLLTQADYEECAFHLRGWVAEILQKVAAGIKEREREGVGRVQGAVSAAAAAAAAAAQREGRM